MKSCWTDYGTRSTFSMLLVELQALKSAGFDPAEFNKRVMLSPPILPEDKLETSV